MLPSRRLISAAVAALVALTPLAARADEGLTSSGSIVIQAIVSGQKINVGSPIALYRLGSAYRLDVQALVPVGTDPTVGAFLASALPIHSFTYMYDGATSTTSAYSNDNHTYYQETKRAMSGAATPAPVAQTSSGSDPLSMIAMYGRLLRDDKTFSATLDLAGHTTTNGHPATNVNLEFKQQKTGGALQDYRAHLALADDLDGFPVQIALDSVGAKSTDFAGALRLDLTNVQRAAPTSGTFSIPNGFTRVNSLGELLRPQGR